MRKEFSRDALLMGTIGRQALMNGREAINREVRAKVSRLMEDGGFIPAVDDMILPDISFDSFMYYVELIRDLKF